MSEHVAELAEIKVQLAEMRELLKTAQPSETEAIQWMASQL